MVKARKAGVPTPCVYFIDSSNTKIYMERIDGVTAKQFLLNCMDSELVAPLTHVVMYIHVCSCIFMYIYVL